MKGDIKSLEMVVFLALYRVVEREALGCMNSYNFMVRISEER
jgi:hypothetical protein